VDFNIILLVKFSSFFVSIYKPVSVFCGVEECDGQIMVVLMIMRIDDGNDDGDDVDNED